jgi:DNA-binding beta-propeller fold protein YncE
MRASMPWASAGIALVTSLAVLGTLAAPTGHASAAAPNMAPLPAHIAPSIRGTFGPPGDNWSMFMGDPEHTSDQSISPSLSSATASNLSLRWSFKSGGAIISEPIVANDRVYFGAWDGYEYSLWASNGTKVWATNTGQSSCTLTARHLVGVTSTATLTNTDLYFGGGKDYWEALSPSNGSRLWQIYSGNSNGTQGDGYYNWASPLIYNGSAYIGLSSHCDNPLVQGQLLKVNLTTHRVVQVFNTTPRSVLGATIWSSPAVNPSTGTIFFATGNLYTCCGTNSSLDDSIVEVNATRMTEVAHFQVPYAERILDGDFGASVTLFQSDTGIPMVGDDNKNGLYFALNQSDLAAGPLWTDNISLIAGESSAAFAHGNLYVGSARTTDAGGGVVQGSVRSINATTGVVNWQRTMAGNVYGPPVVVGDVVVAAGGTELAVLSSLTGKVLYRFNSSADFYGGPSVAGGRIYIGNVYGTLYCVGFPLAATASANTTGGPAPLSVAFHGTGFGGGPGYTYAWNFGDGTHSVKDSPNHLYKISGSYLAVLKITDQFEEVASADVPILVTEPPSQTVTVGATPSFACYDIANGYEYVTNAGSSNVSLIANAKLVGTINVGSNPASIVYDSTNHYVYVANTGSANITVISGKVVVGTVTVGANPGLMTFDPQNGDIYIPDSNNVTVVKGVGVVSTVPVGTLPSRATYDALTDLVYVPNFGSANVSVLRGTTVLASVEVGANPSSISIDGRSGLAYVSNQKSNNVSVINGTSLDGTIPVASAPMQSVYDPEDGYVYVSLRGHSLAVLHGIAEVDSLSVGTSPGAQTYDGANGYVYVPNAATDNVSVIDDERVLDSIAVGSGPTFADFAGTGAYVYVLNQNSSNVSAILTHHYYAVSFVETGLPSSMNWAVNLSEFRNSSKLPTIGFSEFNGSYAYSISAAPGFAPHPSTGSVQINGSDVDIPVAFVSVNYSVTFAATGLPLGQMWSTTLNGTVGADTIQTGQASNISYAEPNGTYPYTIGAPLNFVATKSAGQLTVHGANLTVMVTFIRWTSNYTVAFVEAGLPGGMTWSVELGGTTMNATLTPPLYAGIEIQFPGQLNGSYAFEVTAPSGYWATPEFGNLSVAGHDVNVTIAFSQTYPVVFSEQSLPVGVQWSIDLGGSLTVATVSGSGGTTLPFFRPNGTYAYSVGAPPGYSATVSNGNIVVHGGNVSLAVEFVVPTAPARYTVIFAESGLPYGTTWTVTFNGSTVTGVGQLRFPGIANGTYSFTVPNLTGYSPTPSAGSLQVSGTPSPRTIAFGLSHPVSPGTPSGPSGAMFLGLPAIEGYGLLAGGLALIAIGALFVYLRAFRGRPPESQRPPPQSRTPPAHE